jgi:undecaprenyl-diphosphatase
MNTLSAVLLGIIEGLTEFIPISSTAHLLILQHILNIPADASVFAFLVLVQLGPLIALLIYFRKEYVALVRAFFSRPLSSPENKLAWYVVIATLPALLAGFLLKDFVQALFQNPLSEAAIRLFTAAILLFLAEWLGKRTRNLDSLAWQDSLIIGLFQVLAVFPGSSRSGATIPGGMFRNLNRPSATHFSFLMAAPVLLAAGGYESIAVIRMNVLHTMLVPLVVGIAAAAVIGWLAIRWLIGYVSKHSLYIFAAYCFVVAVLCLLVSLI